MTPGSRRIHQARYFNTGAAGIAIVAVETVGIDWSAYIGADNGQSEAACCEEAARNGEKLRKEDAEHFFPALSAALPYRV